jgi:hypothetical protein
MAILNTGTNTGTNVVQTAENFVATFSHSSILGGTDVTLKGFKLGDIFVRTEQVMDNSKE